MGGGGWLVALPNQPSSQSPDNIVNIMATKKAHTFRGGPLGQQLFGPFDPRSLSQNGYGLCVCLLLWYKLCLHMRARRMLQ